MIRMIIWYTRGWHFFKYKEEVGKRREKRVIIQSFLFYTFLLRKKIRQRKIEIEL